MEETNGSDSPTRLDRIERLVEVLANTAVDMRSEVQFLMRSQVLMSESLEKLTAKVVKLADAQLHTDESMHALILTVDEIIRGRKPQ